MSLKEEQPQEYNLRAGLAMFNNQVIPRSNLDGEEKPNAQVSVRKESTSSNNTPPVKNTNVASSPSTTSSAKLVGSNRFFVPPKK